jgi:hypothetical protein
MPAGFGTSRQDSLVTIPPTAGSVVNQETGDAEEDEGQFFEKVASRSRRPWRLGRLIIRRPIA